MSAPRLARMLACPAVLAGVAGCSFSPSLARYLPCDAGACPPGQQCLSDENVCISLCGEGPECLLSITSTSLPPATMCVAYSVSISASGGTPPYTWSLVDGQTNPLPSGISFDKFGLLSGTPTEAGAFPLTVEVSDRSTPPQDVVASLTLDVPTGTLTETDPSTLQSTVVGVPYRYHLSVSGGTPPHTWTLCAGALPDGLTLSTVGDIGGTPTTAGTYDFVVLVTDSVGATGAKALTLTVTP